MLAEARRHDILARLSKAGQVTTDDLAVELGVSVETVRRDLHVLEGRHQLERVHGGAVLSGKAQLEAPRHERRTHAFAEKQAIARTICDHLPDDALVFLDVGTTVEQVADALPVAFRGTVVTTSLRIAYQLSERDHLDVLVAPGKLRQGELALSGSATLAYLASFNPDVAVISTGAVDPRRGVTDYELEERAVKETMLAQSVTTYVVADSTKFNQVAPYKVCDLSAATYLVTTPAIGETTMNDITQHGGHLLLANENSTCT